MEREKAKALWEQSRRIIDVKVAKDCLTPGDFPLWVSQNLFLHCWYAAWLGDNKLLEWALARRGAIATVLLFLFSLIKVCHTETNCLIKKWHNL